jgi:hypothetical protein
MPKPIPDDVKPLLTKLMRIGVKATRFWAGGFTATEIAVLAADLIELGADLAEAARED